jgi:V/A-type H+-transporting ATPase subunit B
MTAPLTRHLTRYTHIVSIVGDILTVRARDVGLGDLAVVENWDGEHSLAQTVQVRHDEVSLQVFTGGKGLSTGGGWVFRPTPR